MSTTTPTSTPSQATPPAPAGAERPPSAFRLSFAGILRSEWIKLRTVRSTSWSYAIVVVISLGMAAIMSAALDLQDGGPMPAAVQAAFVVQASTFGVFFGQLVVGVLGVLVVTGEYSTGMIRSTLTAVPRRLPALWAKAAVLFTATFVVGAIATLGSFLVAGPMLAGKGIHASLVDGAVIVPLLAGALYLALVAVFALGVGAILRNSAGGIAATLGMLLLLPIVLSMIPATWANDLVPYLISNAGTGMMASGGQAVMEPWQALLVVLGWLAVSLAGAALLLKRRDA
ncbi:ABC transporter permease subunit [Cryobacterium tagatosivorans]|uniref:ABC transporter permease n=1 Tax=Cryobacterium tagatosivorans TaxID=1259199 RepID=A0A4R8UHD1_9MICO|nr:ABC transporter permease subunit [Cryobacterium tagatosivorans]TFB51761.1 ABC transporter permease [Cryobacterium tagatosivorans]